MSTSMVRTTQRQGEVSRTVQPARQSPPPLNPGDRLSRAEFERRYHAHPEIKKAELIEGVVYMPTPVCHLSHGRPHAHIVGWLTHYCARTPGIDLSDNATLRLDFENELQPDALLRLPTELGGKSKVAEDGFLEGAPELIVEIAASSVSYDLHVKKRVYARSGVQEYLAIQSYEQSIEWFVLDEGVYQLLPPDENGVLRSRAFPGLWLDPAAFWAGDLERLLAVLEQGLQSPEHAIWVARLRL